MPVLSSAVLSAIMSNPMSTISEILHHTSCVETQKPGEGKRCDQVQDEHRQASSLQKVLIGRAGGAIEPDEHMLACSEEW